MREGLHEPKPNHRHRNNLIEKHQPATCEAETVDDDDDDDEGAHLTIFHLTNGYYQ